MQLLDGRMLYSASDLNDYLECAHSSELSRAVARGELARPAEPAGVTQRSLLSRKGDEHERRYLQRLRETGAEVADLTPDAGESLERSCRRTRAALEAGHQYIYQPTFFDGTFVGRADFLRRIDEPNPARAWSYAPIDAKLARSAKPYFLVQLASYAEQLAALQGGALPRTLHVALGSGEERAFATRDVMAYFRHLKAGFLAWIARDEGAYPLPCAHCALCPWDARCDRQRRDDDHLSLVAWMRRDQAQRLADAGITTLAALAASRPEERPHGFNPHTFDDLRRQAQLQRAQRDARRAGVSETEALRYMLLDARAGEGLKLLPAPDPGDAYFDIEGDPLYAPDAGLEYLFGLYLPHEDRYQAFWARSAADERAAVIALIDFLAERRRRHPAMHVYHYANYEKAALGRLTSRYAVRRDELDALLRGQVFVDLYTVVRQSLRISQESYSIKKLEPFYGFTRNTELRRGDDSIVLFETWLDTGEARILDEIERYNADDCRSTAALHGWLLERRSELAGREGRAIPWRTAPEEVIADEAQGDEREVRAVRDAIVGTLAPIDLQALARASDDERLRWLLGNAVDYHYAEAKPEWWRYHYRRENLDELREFDRDALGDLERDDANPPYCEKRSMVYTYTFPEQAHGFREGSSGVDPISEKSLNVVAVDEVRRSIRIKSTHAEVLDGLRALIPPTPMRTDVLQRALVALGKTYLDGTFAQRYPAIVDMLLVRHPRLRGRAAGATLQPERVDGGVLADAIADLDRSYLLVQGPPGTGKSTLAGDAIAQLLARGLRVGILARSHKVAHNLLTAVERAAETRGVGVDGAHKCQDRDDETRYVSPLEVPRVVNESAAAAALDARYRLVSGTAWLFSDERAADAFDVLIVDEAGQLALADAVACARAARSIVLLGDPLQLGTIAHGSHPPGLGVSILEHLLGDRATVAPEYGIFLRESWRMHPALCSFISEAVYEGRLTAAPGNEANVIEGAPLEGSGLRAIAVEHTGNQRSSREEAGAIVAAVKALRSGEKCVRAGRERALARGPIEDADILVVTPYNAQRETITNALHAAGFPGVRVGTVDKFQGQQAPVVFYSMATSSGDDLPRDLEFLFEKNRFNVAISRAQCMSVLVYSPRLLEVRTRSPEQIALVNLLCAYVAAAQVPGENPIAIDPSAV